MNCRDRPIDQSSGLSVFLLRRLKLDRDVWNTTRLLLPAA